MSPFRSVGCWVTAGNLVGSLLAYKRRLAVEIYGIDCKFLTLNLNTTLSLPKLSVLASANLFAAPTLNPSSYPVRIPANS
jgi:hypothetical protein